MSRIASRGTRTRNRSRRPSGFTNAWTVTSEGISWSATVAGARGSTGAAAAAGAAAGEGPAIQPIANRPPATLSQERPTPERPTQRRLTQRREKGALLQRLLFNRLNRPLGPRGYRRGPRTAPRRSYDDAERWAIRRARSRSPSARRSLDSPLAVPGRTRTRLVACRRSSTSILARERHGSCASATFSSVRRWSGSFSPSVGARPP